MQQQQSDNGENDNDIDIEITTPNFIAIKYITAYITFPIGYKLIEAGGAKDMLQKQGLSIDGLNNNKDTTLQ